MRPAVAGNQGSGLIGRDVVPADDVLSCEIGELRVSCDSAHETSRGVKAGPRTGLPLRVRVPAPEGKQGVRTDRGDDFRAAGWPASQLATSASLAISPGRPRSLSAGLSDRGAAASRRVPSVADKEVFGADGHDSGRADDATSRAAGDLHDQLHGGGYGPLWRRDEHVAVSARTASSTGQIGGSSSRYSFPSESELVVAGPARLHMQRPGRGAAGTDGDCVACAGEGAVWCRRARRRSHVVLVGLGLVRCAPGTGGVGCRRFGLSAPRIRRVQAERGISGRASRLLQAGPGCHRLAPDLHRVGSRRRRSSALLKVRRSR